MHQLNAKHSVPTIEAKAEEDGQTVIKQDCQHHLL
jgi:hypothetical protein